VQEDNISFTITPESGYQIAALVVDGQSVNPVSSYTFRNINADHSISAAFSAVVHSPVYASGGGGSVSAPQTVIRLSGLSSTSSLITDMNGIAKSKVNLQSREGQISLEIAQGTALKDVRGAGLKNLTVSIPTVLPAPPEEFALISGYLSEPSGAKFTPALTLTLRYDPARLPMGFSETNLYIAHYNGTTWSPLESLVDTAARTVPAKITHFSEYALMVKAATSSVQTAEIPGQSAAVPDKIDLQPENEHSPVSSPVSMVQAFETAASNRAQAAAANATPEAIMAAVPEIPAIKTNTPGQRTRVPVADTKSIQWLMWTTAGAGAAGLIFLLVFYFRIRKKAR
jgi:hypothetical protein